MKKILFSAYSMEVGGIETALITLLKNLSTKYEITLVLEKNQGTFLNEIPKNVKVIIYKPSDIKFVPFRKITNFIKQMCFKIKYKNKFDFSACYATYSFPASFVARTASKNCALWVHNNYMNFYNDDISKYRNFFKSLKVYEFRKIVFVSDMDKKIFTAQFPECRKKVIVCNNLIDYKKIEKEAEEKIEDFEKDNVTTFINLGRHDEKQKKITRIINATKKLNDEGYKFKVLLVGKGNDTEDYKKQAKDIKNIIFLGSKQNPYPYLKNSDALLMSSEFEGYPVVFVEAKILNKPIITTEVSDSKKDVEENFGIVVEKSEDGVYQGMKEFLDKGFTPKKFNPEKFNKDILEKLEEIIKV